MLAAQAVKYSGPFLIEKVPGNTLIAIDWNFHASKRFVEKMVEKHGGDAKASL